MLAQQIGGIGHRSGLIGLHLDEHAPPLTIRVGDAREGFLDQCPAGGGSRGQGLGEFVNPAHDASDRESKEHAMTDTPAKPVLLTGASGALGRVLVKSLGAQGWRLVLTDIAPFPDPLPPGATFTKADLSDGVTMLRLAEGCGAIVHLGGVSVERPFEEVIGPNIRGLYHIY
jgi:NAD dependent epimerase/dehydratase family